VTCVVEASTQLSSEDVDVVPIASGHGPLVGREKRLARMLDDCPTVKISASIVIVPSDCFQKWSTRRIELTTMLHGRYIFAPSIPLKGLCMAEEAARW
jgi:hypothetical protein